MRKSARRFSAPLALCLLSAFTFAQQQQAHRLHFRNPPMSVQRPMSADAVQAIVTKGAAATNASGANLLPVFNYQVVSNRSGFLFQGVIVGANPETRGSAAKVSVKAQLIPVVLHFHSLGVSADLKTGIVSTAPGGRTSDPTMPDAACFAGPVNVPVDVVSQSPIFQNADFNFGGTDVGTTQYIDAFQRANFWSQIDRNNYHTLLKLQLLAPLDVDVPADQGLSLNPDIFHPNFGICGP